MIKEKYILTGLKYSFSLSCILFCFSNGKTQPYYPIFKNSDWWEYWMYPWVGDAYYYYYPKGDTLINGNKYLIYDTNTNSDIFVREDSAQKKIWKWSNINSSDVLLYDFNLNTGDFFVYGTETAVVAMIDTVLIDAGFRKRYILDWSNPTVYNTYIIEGVGSLIGPFRIQKSMIMDDGSSDLKCFRQDGQMVYSDDIRFLCGSPQELYSLDYDNVSCYGYCNGYIEVTPLAGNPPYQYAWANGDTINSAGNLCPGYYSLTITDADSNYFVAPVDITQPQPLNITSTTVAAICSTCVGSAFVQLSGGNPQASTWWSISPSVISKQTTDSTCAITALPGTYTVGIMIFGGCTLETYITIGWTEECWKLSAAIYVPEDTIVYNVNGTTVTFTSTSANAVNYFWDFGDGDTSVAQNPIHTYNSPGIYTVMLVGSNGYCSDTDYVTITVLDVGIEKAGCYYGGCGNKIKLYHNPAAGNIVLEIIGTDGIKSYQLTVVDISGKEIRRIQTNADKIQVDISEYNAGLYLIQINNGNNYYSFRFVKI